MNTSQLPTSGKPRPDSPTLPPVHPLLLPALNPRVRSLRHLHSTTQPTKSILKRPITIYLVTEEGSILPTRPGPYVPSSDLKSVKFPSNGLERVVYVPEHDMPNKVEKYNVYKYDTPAKERRDSAAVAERTSTQKDSFRGPPPHGQLPQSVSRSQTSKFGLTKVSKVLEEDKVGGTSKKKSKCSRKRSCENNDNEHRQTPMQFPWEPPLSAAETKMARAAFLRERTTRVLYRSGTKMIRNSSSKIQYISKRGLRQLDNEQKRLGSLVGEVPDTRQAIEQYMNMEDARQTRAALEDMKVKWNGRSGRELQRLVRNRWKAYQGRGNNQARVRERIIEEDDRLAVLDDEDDEKDSGHCSSATEFKSS